MLSKESKTAATVFGLAVTLLGGLLSIAATEVWNAKADHEKRLTTVEVRSADDKALLMEVREDVKEILRRLPSK